MVLTTEQKKEKNAIRAKKYVSTPEGRKTARKANWKRRGLIWESVDELNDIYNRYLNSLRCEKCSGEYTKNNKKCMDHDHITGKFRNILCIACNVVTDVKLPKNKCGINNINYCNGRKKWRYRRQIKNKIISRTFKFFIQAVIFKREYEESL